MERKQGRSVRFPNRHLPESIIADVAEEVWLLLALVRIRIVIIGPEDIQTSSSQHPFTGFKDAIHEITPTNKLWWFATNRDSTTQSAWYILSSGQLAG